MSKPRYLRVALTEKCPMRCTFCHNEGADTSEKSSRLTVQYWERHLSNLVEFGIRKVKFVGGEPLLYRELPTLIARLRKRYPTLDLSIITSGSLPVSRLEDCFDAGLSRANMSIHGWQKTLFERNSKLDVHYQNRQATLDYLLKLGRPLKLNYVYTDDLVEEDLGLLLQTMQHEKVVVNVLDDLNNPSITPQYLLARLTTMMGKPVISRDTDPNSLNTLHMNWGGLMSVEIKDQHLGVLAPWKACQKCPKRSKCTEGIHAIRMYADGKLGLCMDRDDLRWSSSLTRGQALSAMDFIQSNLTRETV